MNFQSKAQPVGCTGLRRIATHIIWQSVALAAVALLGLCEPAASQTATLSGNVATGAVSCAPSNNGTGHMVCLEYSTAGALIGVSWQAPPQGLHVPGDQLQQPAEPANTIDTDPLMPNLGATAVGVPGCTSENLKDFGAIVCLIVSKTASGSFLLQGISFYPPTDAAKQTAPFGLLALGTEPANTVIGNPSCASAGTGGAASCAITINGHLFGVGFAPRSNVTTPLTSLLSGASVTGNPACASAENGGTIPVNCVVREGNTLVGFALAFTPPAAAIASEDIISLGAMTFTGDPSCDIPADGVIPADPVTPKTSFVATCGIASGTTLFGVSFDPIDAIPSTSSHTTALLSLGKAPDTGNWTGNISCSGIADFRKGVPTPAVAFPNMSPNQNLIGCVALSTANKVFEATFDPRASVSRAVIGPFGGNATARPSCLFLNVDRENIYCAATTTTGVSAGYTVPVGILPPGSFPGLAQFVSD